MDCEIKSIVVDPRFKVNYAAYYLYGIKSLLKSPSISFRCIESLEIETDKDTRVGFAMEITTTKAVKHIYIDYGDWNEIEEKYYIWADVYAKINVRPEDASREKLVVIGPSFGIRLWNPIKCMLVGIKNYRRINRTCGTGFKRDFKHYIVDYGFMFLRRRPYKRYYRFSEEEEPGYLFSFSTLWYGKFAHESINKLRGEFMREGIRLMPHFEGGFFYNNKVGVVKEFPKYVEYLQDYSDLISMKRISKWQYDKRNRKSWFVFNTPSVGGCHGWKLAEFLCEGKAIISSHLLNLMPGDFNSGMHYIEANTPDEMANAIVQLRDNKHLVQSLKKNAFQYFNHNLAPEVVMKRVFDRAGI